MTDTSQAATLINVESLIKSYYQNVNIRCHEIVDIWIQKHFGDKIEINIYPEISSGDRGGNSAKIGPREEG